MLVLILEAVPDGWIVAGSDNDGATGSFSQNTKAYHRCWRGSGAEVNPDVVAGNYLSHRRGEVFGGKAVVIADNQSATRQVCLLQVVGYPLGTGTYIIKGEVLSDNAPPAIGAEFNGSFYLPHPPCIFRFKSIPTLPPSHHPWLNPAG